MAQYIDKAAVVAEIDRLRNNAWESFSKGNSIENQYYLRNGVIMDILSFIDTLEVKEVGYEWDDEKKELKKVEQESTDNPDTLIEESCQQQADALINIVTEEKDRIEYNKGFECGKQRVLKYPEDFGLCKKIAWSEEDERNLDWLITVCERLHYKSDPQVSPEGALILRNWLKYLKERYTWKPSNEQMQALSDAGNSFRPFEEGHKVLWSLYNDLKKLREE